MTGEPGFLLYMVDERWGTGALMSQMRVELHMHTQGQQEGDIREDKEGTQGRDMERVKMVHPKNTVQKQKQEAGTEETSHVVCGLMSQYRPLLFFVTASMYCMR